MKPWQLVKTDPKVDVPVTGDKGQPWDREKPDPTYRREVSDAPLPSGSLTRSEFEQYFEQSRRIALSRLDAENFEMEMRRDFAERRLKKLEQA